jgi:hypothetical protein
MQIDFANIPDLIDRPSLSRLLNRHPTTLARAEERGALHSIRLNARTICYTRESVCRWLLNEPRNPSS